MWVTYMYNDQLGICDAITYIAEVYLTIVNKYLMCTKKFSTSKNEFMKSANYKNDSKKTVARFLYKKSKDVHDMMVL